MTRMFRSVSRLMLGVALAAAGCTSAGSTDTSVLPASPRTTSEKGPVPVIVDYSPTVSDVGGLLYLLSHPGVDVRAVTLPVTGEAGCDLGVEVTLGILTMFERDGIPVACDPEVPPHAEVWPAEFLAGDEALAAGLPASAASPDARPAHRLIADVVAASDEPVRLYAVAPLTNVARALERSPEVAEGLESIVIMGGAVDVPGNVPSANAEWNFWIDVPAAASVLDSEVPKTLVPLDATNDAPVPSSWSDALAAAEQSAAVVYLNGLVETFPAVTSGSFYFWDELAASVAAGDDLVDIEEMGVAVTTEAGSDYGRTVRDPEASPASVAIAVPDPNRFSTEFLATLAGAPVDSLAGPAVDSPPTGGAVDPETLASWLMAAIAGDLEAATGFVAADAIWIGPVGASPQAFIEGSAPYETYDAEVSCSADQRAATCEMSWNDRWIDAIPSIEQGQMRVVAVVEDGTIVAFEEWTYDPDLVAAFNEHFAWLECEHPDRLAEACAADSGAKPCSELLVATVDEWVATTP